ncbi:MAG TPA: hypothetical protein VFH11_13800 [Gemmatimonadota bacterium]|nr:hypothetical protein [Gemmatimonadota bacterium]
METKTYETPKVEYLGSVKELTAATSPPTNCSALPTDFASDALCEPELP